MRSARAFASLRRSADRGRTPRRAAPARRSRRRTSSASRGKSPTVSIVPSSDEREVAERRPRGRKPPGTRTTVEPELVGTGGQRATRGDRQRRGHPRATASSKLASVSAVFAGVRRDHTSVCGPAYAGRTGDSGSRRPGTRADLVRARGARRRRRPSPPMPQNVTAVTPSARCQAVGLDTGRVSRACMAGNDDDRAEHVARRRASGGLHVVQIGHLPPAPGPASRPRRSTSPGCRRGSGTDIRTWRRRAPDRPRDSRDRPGRWGTRGSPAAEDRGSRCLLLVGGGSHASPSPRINASTSAVFSASSSGVRASALSLSNGSVFDGRTLHHQSSNSTVRPSSRSWRPSA